MTVIASPPPVPMSFHHGNTLGNFAGPSNNPNGHFPVRPARQSASSNPAPHGLASLQSDSTGAVEKQRFTNGHAPGDLPMPTPNHNLSPEQQELIRSRTENQRLVHRPRAQLMRTQTDFGPNHQARPARGGPAEETGELRHGWEDQYNSSEFLGLLSSVSGLETPPLW